jgi:hypothetical protein
MLYAQVDAIVSPIAWMGFLGIEVRVSKTSWLSKGDLGQIGAMLECATTYNRNVLVPWFFFFSYTSGPATEQAHFNFFFFQKKFPLQN